MNEASKGEPGVPGVRGRFDNLIEDVCCTLVPFQLSGQFAGNYLRREEVVKLIERHAQREDSGQKLQMVSVLNNLMTDMMGCTSSLEPEKMHTSSVMKKFLAAIQKIQSGEM